MPQRIDLAELRAARKMEPKLVVLDDQELELPADIPLDVIVSIMDNDFRGAFEGVFGPDWRQVIRRFGFTLRDVLDIVQKHYLPDMASLGESLASGAPSNGTVRR